MRHLEVGRREDRRLAGDDEPEHRVGLLAGRRSPAEAAADRRASSSSSASRRRKRSSARRKRACWPRARWSSSSRSPRTASSSSSTRMSSTPPRRPRSTSSPDRVKGLTDQYFVEIQGHTDDTGGERYNEELGQRPRGRRAPLPLARAQAPAGPHVDDLVRRHAPARVEQDPRRPLRQPPRGAGGSRVVTRSTQ